MNITFDTITKKFAQVIPPKKACYICPSDIFVDDHHIDLAHGKISDETVPLCRRCHCTIGMHRGIHMFEDNLLDKAIEVYNMTQALYNRPLMTRDKIVRSKYWLKKHGIKGIKGVDDGKDSQTPAFPFNLPRGEPLCGWEWVNEHQYDYLEYVPRIEVVGPNLNLAVNINSRKDLKEVSKALRGLRVKKGSNNDGNKRAIIYDPINKVFSEV